MVTIDDILHHIAQDLRNHSGVDLASPIDKFVSGCRFKLHLSITTDVEDTEFNYMERYGKGRTFYFRLHIYDHGKTLARQVFTTLHGSSPDMDGYLGLDFGADSRLYLFIHLKDIAPLLSASAS